MYDIFRTYKIVTTLGDQHRISLKSNSRIKSYYYAKLNKTMTQVLDP